MIPAAYTYLLVNAACISVPLLFSFHPRLRFDLHLRSFLWSTFAVFVVFVPWDISFTALGIWGFNSTYVTGHYLLGLPWEEWAFFICIPYACMYTYHCFTVLVPRVPGDAFFRKAAPVIAWGFVGIGLLCWGRWYTTASFTLCGIFLLLHLYRWKSTYLPRFLFTFSVLLVPFVISNGVLTGLAFWRYPVINTDPAAIADHIVWYNNAHNLGIRLFTMPVDDIPYGLTLLLIGAMVYEQRRARYATSSDHR